MIHTSASQDDVNASCNVNGEKSGQIMLLSFSSPTQDVARFNHDPAGYSEPILT